MLFIAVASPPLAEWVHNISSFCPLLLPLIDKLSKCGLEYIILCVAMMTTILSLDCTQPPLSLLANWSDYNIISLWFQDEILRATVEEIFMMMRKQTRILPEEWTFCWNLWKIISQWFGIENAGPYIFMSCKIYTHKPSERQTGWSVISHLSYFFLLRWWFFFLLPLPFVSPEKPPLSVCSQVGTQPWLSGRQHSCPLIHSLLLSDANKSLRCPWSGSLSLTTRVLDI